MDRATDPDTAFDLPEGAFGLRPDEDPEDVDVDAVGEDPATAAAREAQQELRLAQELRRPIDRAVSMATMAAWTLAVFAVISLPGVFSSFTGFFIVVGLGACSFFEFRGRNALREMRPAGATALARNQLVLGAVIVVYALANIVTTLGGEGRYDQAVAAVPELEQIMGSGNGLGGLMTTLTLMYYGVVGVGGAVGQCLMYLFHDRRRPLVEAFVADTPEWITRRADENGPPDKVGRAA